MHLWHSLPLSMHTQTSEASPGAPEWRVHWAPEDQAALVVQKGQSLLLGHEVPVNTKHKVYHLPQRQQEMLNVLWENLSSSS